MTQRRNRWPAWRPIGGLVLLLVAGCHRVADDPLPGSANPPAVPTVAVVKPLGKEMRRVIEQPAQVEAFEETPLIARIPGYVGKVTVDIGDIIAADGVLAELLVPEMVEEQNHKAALVLQAEAEVTRAKAAHSAALAHAATSASQVHEAKAGREKVQSNYDRWDREYQRLAELAAKKVIDEQSRDEARNQAQAAEALCKEMDARIKSAEAIHRESQALADKAGADVTVAEANVKVAKAEEGRQAAMLRYAQIRAPYRCVVVKRNVHTGHFLQPGTGSNSQPVFVVARADKLRVSVDVPETDALLIKEGQEVVIRVQSIKNRDFKGPVVRTAWSLDTKSRTLRVEVDLKNDDDVLRPGMYAYASFTVQHGTRMALPATAIVTQGDNTFCWFAADGKVKRIAVKTGVRDGRWVEVLKRESPSNSGVRWVDFTGEEVIVAANPGALAENQAVHVKQ